MNRIIQSFCVQLYDDPSGDRSLARFVSFGQPQFRAGQFVIISCSASGRKFLGNVSGPNLNFNRNALASMDNTAINQLEQISEGKMNRDVAVHEIFGYDIILLKEIVAGQAQSVRVRPQIGALANPATDDEIVNLLGLPEISSEKQVGSIIDTKVPICLSKSVLMQHTLVAGAAGAGKTNTISNITTAATNMGMCVVIFDHKPDYQHLHFANDEGVIESNFAAISDVQYWAIGSPFEVENREETPIRVAEHELDAHMLMATIFHLEGEEIQLEVCEGLLQHYINEVLKNPNWTIPGFKGWLMPLTAAQAPGNPKSDTLGAVKRKINSTARIPHWIDGAKPAKMSAQVFKSNAPKFNPSDLIRPGRVIVIRVGSEVSDGRDYGLLLSHISDNIHQAAERRKLPCPVLFVIDEAQDIFSASRIFKQAALGSLDRGIRKGRSKRIGYVIGVQSAESVPESILNNLNSRIIHRHNSHEQVRIAAVMASEDQRRMTNTFGAGEALVSLIGSNGGMVHAKMQRSPFKLTKQEL
jgi:Helicase HerA, central domain